MLHNLLRRPLLVNWFKHLALLLREEYEGWERSFRRHFTYVEGSTEVAHVNCRISQTFLEFLIIIYLSNTLFTYLRVFDPIKFPRAILKFISVTSCVGCCSDDLDQWLGSKRSSIYQQSNCLCLWSGLCFILSFFGCNCCCRLLLTILLWWPSALFRQLTVLLWPISAASGSPSRRLDLISGWCRWGSFLLWHCGRWLVLYVQNYND